MYYFNTEWGKSRCKFITEHKLWSAGMIVVMKEMKFDTLT